MHRPSSRARVLGVVTSIDGGVSGLWLDVVDNEDSSLRGRSAIVWLYRGKRDVSTFTIGRLGKQLTVGQERRARQTGKFALNFRVEVSIIGVAASWTGMSTWWPEDSFVVGGAGISVNAGMGAGI